MAPWWLFAAQHLYHLSSLSAVPSSVASLKVQSSGRTDRLTVSWQHGEGSWSSYEVKLCTRLNLCWTRNHCDGAGWIVLLSPSLSPSLSCMSSKRHFGCLQVVLYDVSGATLGAQTLGADHTSHTFSGLTPGRLYRSDVITHSGDLTNRISALGRTCE